MTKVFKVECTCSARKLGSSFHAARCAIVKDRIRREALAHPSRRIKKGSFYKVTMRGEPDFGGRVKVDYVSRFSIRAHFEIKGWIDDQALHFNINTGANSGVFYRATRNDAFLSNKVHFTPCK